jgi:hypothetical protein
MTAPASVDQDLMVRARELAAEAREVPSIRALKAGLRVGDARAKVAREVLLAEQRQRRMDRRAAMRQLASKRPSGRRGGGLPAALGAHLEALLPQPPAPAGSLVITEASAPVPAAETARKATVAGAPVMVFAGPPAPFPIDPDAPVDKPAEGTRAATTASAPVPGLRRVRTWPAFLVAVPAAVAIWAGWVAIGKLTGFGRVNLLPGFGRGWVVDTAITLPVGVEAYAAYAFYVALNPAAPFKARRFAGWSAGLAVVLGMGGQTAYHLMTAAGMTAAPWQITTLVSCLPVGVFALVAVLVHLVHADSEGR